MMSTQPVKVKRSDMTSLLKQSNFPKEYITPPVVIAVEAFLNKIGVIVYDHIEETRVYDAVSELPHSVEGTETRRDFKRKRQFNER
jgi:hypothetical protein